MEKIHGARVYHQPTSVFVASDVPDNADSSMAQKGFRVERRTIESNPKGAELINALHGADVLIPRTSLVISKEVLEATELGLIQGACVQPNVDVETARRLGVQVLNVQTNFRQVVQLTLADILAFSSGNVAGSISTREGKWEKNQIGRRNFDVRKVKLGILGFGKIGQELARQAQALGMQVAVHNDHAERFRSYDEKLATAAAEIGVDMMPTPDHLAQWANILTLHMSSQDHMGRPNKAIVDAKIVKALCDNVSGLPGGYLINNARRDILELTDQEINKSLKSGELAGYATDVFNKEVENSRDFRYPLDLSSAAITTPHIGGSNDDFLMEAAQEAGSRVERWAETGSFKGSLLNPRESIRIHPESGQIVLAVSRHTGAGIIGKMGEIAENNGLSMVEGDTIHSTGDKIPGTRVQRDVAQQVLVLETPSGENHFDTKIAGVVGELCELNKVGPDARGVLPIIAVRPIPTNDHQRNILREVRFAPNLSEV